MKHGITFLLILLLAGGPLQAQKIRLGVQMGVSMAKVKYESSLENTLSDPKFGFTAGMTMNMNLGKHFILQPELNWTQKGAKWSQTYPNGNKATATTTLNYLELPLKVIYSTKGDHGFFFGGGPAIAYGLYATVSQDGHKQYFRFGREHYGAWGSDTYVIGRSLDLSLLATVGHVTAGGFSISLTYGHGLTNYSNDMGTNTRNNYASLRLGYFFRKTHH